MILFLSDLWLPFPGGAERLMFNLARDLHRRGEDVRVVTGYREAKQFDGPPVRARKLRGGEEVDIGELVLTNIIDKMRPDVIVAHHYWAFQFEEVLAWSGVPIVQIVLNNRRLDCADFAVVISNEVANRESVEMRPGDLLMTPPAFDDVIAPEHGDAVGFVKPIHHKGVDLVYEIAREMPERRFVVLRGEWQDIEILPPADLENVELMEPVLDIRDFYSRCRVVLMPSISEDAGTIAQECALNGIPCISSAVEGLLETNSGGVLVRDREVSSWRHAIRQLDRPARYQAVVDSQRAHFAATGQEQRLEEFALKVKLLAELHRSPFPEVLA